MNKELISIKRKKIDGNKIQGFLIDETKRLILLNYVYDFNLDGLMVLKKENISLLETSETDQFQTELLKSEGIYEKVCSGSKYNLSTWKNLIESMMINHKYFIIEQEEQKDPKFTIGTIDHVGENSIFMKYFTGIGRWLDDLEEIKYSDITSLQVGSNYLNVYERYFSKRSA